MKKSKEYIISVGLFIAALVFDSITIVAGLIPNLDFSLDKICMYLGFACLGFGLVFLKKAKDNNKAEDK